MFYAEGLAALLVVAVSLLAAMALRRRLLCRQGGTIELSLRLRSAATGRGWMLGLGRFDGDALQWYRMFSLAPRPRRSLCRGELELHGRREPTRMEQHALPAGAVVLSCASSIGPVELAMDAAAVTGFLAWLEARPPRVPLPESHLKG